MDAESRPQDRIVQLVADALAHQEQGTLTEEMIRGINEEIQALSLALRADAHSVFVTGLAIGQPVDTSRWEGRSDLEREQDLRLTPEQRRFYNYLRDRAELCLMSEVAHDLYGSPVTAPLKEEIIRTLRGFQSIAIAAGWPRRIEMRAVRVGDTGKELAFLLHMQSTGSVTSGMEGQTLQPYRSAPLPQYRTTPLPPYRSKLPPRRGTT